jgi:uroporphyrinogen decarboxylase
MAPGRFVMGGAMTSHRERLEACLAGQAPDRTPVALWRHFPVDDQTPEGLAAATASFQDAYDFDLVKVTPTSSFCIKDWGVEDRWTGNPEGTRDYLRRAIAGPEDWPRLSILDPRADHLGAQLTCLRLLTGEYRGRTPVIQTIFSPMSQAKNLVGPEALLVHMRCYPDALHQGLQRIAETTIAFLEEAIQTGIDGVFYAVQHGQYGLLSNAEFDEFCRPYDLQVLGAAKGLWLNLLHLHGEAILFDRVLDYPAAVINWHDRQTWPGLAEGQKQFPGAVCGGLRQWETMVLGDPEQVRGEARHAIEATRGRRFILGTGCVLPTTAPRGNILAARQVVDETAH